MSFEHSIIRKFSFFLSILGMVVLLFSFTSQAVANERQVPTLNQAGTSLQVIDGRIELFRGKRKVMSLDSILFNYSSATEWDIVSSNSDEIVLRGMFPAKVDFYRHVSDNQQRMAELRITEVPGGFRLHAAPDWGRQVTLKFDYLKDHFFGLSEPLQPDNRLSPDLTNGVIEVDIVAEHASLQENYASAYSAFYISSYGYGAFFDTFARGEYRFAINGRNRIHHDTGVLDWYLFPGDDGAQIHRAYYELIGAPKYVPPWALGPVGWRDHNRNAVEILDDIEKLSTMKIPFTSWFVDRPYSDGTHAWSKMNFSKAFAKPQKWIKTLRQNYGLEFMTWASPATFGDKVFEKHLPGQFSYIDLSHPDTVDAFQKRLQAQHRVGVKGHKIDRADENFPVYEPWHVETEPAVRRNKYSYLMAKIHDEALREVWGQDQVTFARSAIHRTQPYLSAIWAGDPRTTWDGLQANYANAMRAGFMGFPVWGTDVGGYQGEGYIPENLYIRWMQAGSVSGFFEIKLDGAGGDGRDRMPWQYDEEFQQTFKAICDDRMRFIPYLYSLVNTSKDTGVLMKPLAYQHLEDKHTHYIWDQFYLGDAIMVAPVLTPETSRTIYFPDGSWKDMDSPSKVIEGGKFISMEVPLTKLPRFIRENSLYVTGNIVTGNDRTWNESPKELVVHAYPGPDSTQTEFLYVDIADNDEHKPIAMQRSKDTVAISAEAMNHRVRFDVLLNGAPKNVRQAGKPIEFEYDEKNRRLEFVVPEGQAMDVTVEL